MEQNCSGLIRFMFKKIRKNIAQILFSFLEVLFSILIKLKFSHNVIFSPPIIWLCNENMLLDYSSKTIRVFLMYNESIYILKLKRRIYCYYVPVKPHHLHISHFSPLLPTIISLLHFHLFITLNLNVPLHLSIPLHFILVLFIPILLL